MAAWASSCCARLSCFIWRLASQRKQVNFFMTSWGYKISRLAAETLTTKPTIGAIHTTLRQTLAPTLRTKPTVARSGKEPTKTDAPMLNYIFDAHSAKGKHHHHDYKWGPHFDESDLHLNGSTVTVQIGGTAVLNCRVIYLQDKTVCTVFCGAWFHVGFQVSWIRRKDTEGLELLTTARQTYSGDDRYAVLFQYPDNWRLQISLVKKRDEGLYECQISTHPPKVIQMYLYINGKYFNFQFIELSETKPTWQN